jgi:spermidine synthase
MRFARVSLVFSYGLFSIAAQSLLFREFITAFEGNDISVGIFFSSWFVWVGAGAILAQKAKGLAEVLASNIEFLLLAYLPAFFLQAALIIYARQLVAIEPYELWSVSDILTASVIVNAPISIITGMLFPTACRWAGRNQSEKTGTLAVSYVYALEATGSFIGGAGVTVLLGFGVASTRVFFILAAVVTMSVFLVRLAQSRQWLWLSAPICSVVCLAAGADVELARYMQLTKWRQLLGAGSPAGSFQTAQAEYLYGTYRDQWISLSEGSVVEALPDESSAGRIAAVVLCQKPDAENVLVVGSGLGLCHHILRLPQIETVTWTHCDSQYVRKIGEVIPAELRITDGRFNLLDHDIRPVLEQQQGSFDAVILNLPDATSSVLSRYYTLEFYRLVGKSLSPGGVLAVRIAGGQNIMGTELVNLGASTKLTLEKVFSNLALVPGEDTWFMASDSPEITGEPGTLRDRFASIDGGNRLFNPDALLSVYLPDRADSALKSYSDADMPDEFLLNRDERPLTYLFSLLLAAKQSAAPAARLVKHLVPAGPLPFLIPVLIYALLRSVYIFRSPKNGELSGFDSGVLVFSAGAVGIGVVIVLMYLYQTHFGSLYLHIGIVSSLFMAGAAGGAALARSASAKRKAIWTQVLLFALIFLHALTLGSIAAAPGEFWSHITFAAAFIACGFFCGCYFPVAARQLADCRFEPGRIGSRLEAADHLGAAAGGVVTSLVLVPVLGTGAALYGFAILLVANAVPAAAKVLKRQEAPVLDRSPLKLRGLGYCLFGVGVSVILCSNLLAGVGARLRPSLPQRSVRALAGESRVAAKSATVSGTARRIPYFDVLDANDSLTGYIFSSQDLAPEVRGFGGRINLAVHVDSRAGKLIGFHITRSNETPAYLELLESWRRSLIGRDLFASGLADMDAVSGATVSSEAILSALQTSGRRFATEILGRALEQVDERKRSRARYLPDFHGTYLIAAFLLALIVTFKGGFRTRLLVLGLNLVVGGIWLNAQYSGEQIVTALSWHAPSAALTGAFLFVVAIPLLVVIFGNVYCGYICPFGAAQELVGYVVPRRFKPKISPDTMRQARFVKYVILTALIAVFFTTRDRTTLAADPLISIFSSRSLGWAQERFSIGDLSEMVTLIAAGALVGSVFCTRFWCRYLCPAGAFLSLLGGVSILRRYMPTKKFGKCEFGLSPTDRMDCICCDKCRYEQFSRPRFERKIVARAFLTCIVIAAILVAAVSADRFLQVIGTDLDTAALSASGGRPRDVDLQRVRRMIDQNRLSDKEADYYRQIE